jgi:hypothetical protein
VGFVVVQSLLKYGANLLARDITGRNIIHYAKDPHHGRYTRVAQALDMAKMCLDASYNFDSTIHKTVTLKRLSRRELNGSRGHCGGFDAMTGRLDIYLFGVDGTMSKKKPILVKINNLVESSSTGGGSATVRLVDFHRRNYATALFGV